MLGMNSWRGSFQRLDRALLCITTLRHRRFVDDAVQIVGLPAGSRIRLRYRKSYVSHELWNSARKGELPPLRILIVLAGKSTNGPNVIKPLRVGSVMQAQCAGELLLIDVSLGEFAPDIDPHGTLWHQICSSAQDLPTVFDSSHASAGAYAQILSAPPSSVMTSPSVDAWELVAKGFFEVDSLGGKSDRPMCVPYLFMIDSLPTRASMRLQSNGSLSIESGSRVSLTIHTIAHRGIGIIRNPIGEVNIDVAHPSAKLVTSRRVRVDSTRDAKQVTLLAQPTFRSAHGHLSIRAIVFEYEGAKAGDTCKSDVLAIRPPAHRSEIVIARFDLPLRVGRWMPVLAALTAGTAAGFAVADTKLIEAISGGTWIPIAAGILVFLSLHLGFSREGGA